MSGFAQTYEHPLDVLRQLQIWQAEQACALVVITETVGGAVRSVGALLAVREDGASAGYISGGCIDADVILQAQQAIAENTSRTVRYGAGSPFVDLPLPCGGAIEVMILSQPEARVIDEIATRLEKRHRVHVGYTQGACRVADGDMGDTLTVTYDPKPKIRIAGRGTDCLALSRIAQASGFDVTLQLTDEDDLRAARANGFKAEHLTNPKALPTLQDDAWTAFVLMFHDGDWETPLLEQALSGPAFYIGAVGSRQTHQRRREALTSMAIAADQIRRIHGPIGLVPSLRDASMLAISTLAEVVEAFHNREARTAERTALVLLAAGAASRFEDGDKLLANLNGETVLSQTSKLKAVLPFGQSLAVIGPDQDQRATLLKKDGWQTAVNSQAHTGQATSLCCAIETIEGDPSIDQVMIVLADMPNVRGAHLRALLQAATSNIQAVMSLSEGTLMPPALFRRDQFADLKKLSGDRGAKSVFDGLTSTATVNLSPEAAIDIDTRQDLERVKELANG